MLRRAARIVGNAPKKYAHNGGVIVAMTSAKRKLSRA
jgi:hypothetical protein